MTKRRRFVFRRGWGRWRQKKEGTEGAESKLFILSNMNSKGELLSVTSRAILNNRANQLWHSDISFKTVPARATVLRAVKIPPEHGATEYISLRALYQSLPEASKAEIANLWGIHDYSNSRTKIDPDLVTKEEKKALPPVRRPGVAAQAEAPFSLPRSPGPDQFWYVNLNNRESPTGWQSQPLKLQAGLDKAHAGKCIQSPPVPEESSLP